jgi:peptidoglycan hydrolase CwlO-like protein
MGAFQYTKIGKGVKWEQVLGLTCSRGAWEMPKSLVLIVAGITFCIGLVIGMGAMTSEIENQKQEILQLKRKMARSENTIISLQEQVLNGERRIRQLRKDVEFLEQPFKMPK